MAFVLKYHVLFRSAFFQYSYGHAKSGFLLTSCIYLYNFTFLPQRKYVISTYLTPLQHIKQMRIDFFLGKTVAQGETFEIRIPGIISPTYAGDSSRKIKVKLYGKNERIIAVQTLTSIVDNSL